MSPQLKLSCVYARVIHLLSYMHLYLYQQSHRASLLLILPHFANPTRMRLRLRLKDPTSTNIELLSAKFRFSALMILTLVHLIPFHHRINSKLGQ
jgi:hypothetical protein